MSAAQHVLFDLPGPRARRRHLIGGIVGTALCLGILALALVRVAEKGQFEADKWVPFTESVTWTFYLLPGLWATMKAAAVAIVLSMVLGVVLAMMRMSDIAPLRWATSVFVEFFRAVPVLIMMIFTWVMLVKNPTLRQVSASLGVQAQDVTFVAVVTGLVLYNSSVICEVVRNGVTSLPAGQREAGLSVGLSPSQVRRLILVPQALTAMLPALLSQIVVITKDSALGYIITYPELVSRTRQLGSANANTFVAYLVVAVIFILLNWAITKAAEWIESRQRRRRRGPDPRTAPSVTMEGSAPTDSLDAPTRGA
ncbi:amino acid ABC transporter permease [Ornithinimicrobium pekingense]|uniref:Glutamate ABC transporter permease n=1 Tax=Ornithinimicrobium pekingense TaxID=384677 RepID=A0ABQ2F5D1_9MICO|nr:amino acid ABC transporter permease [Ornithinimicrobium pekingense]GGK61390.1 glutamate ABC transporter permease [Ornithinimicrobium pekingense]